ncbi:MAG TPA: peptidoglycan-associated lipoprotein Pal [Vicinamibacterales bacterium]|nr:peptidoglycan-associated lipoprotein Pal [Vicinamibacterales bacterium]
MTVLQRSAGLLTFCVVVAIGAASCAKKAPEAPPPPPPPAAAPAAPPAPPAPPPPAPPPAAPKALTEEEIFAGKSLEQLNAERPLGDVYFDLDQSTIRDDARGPLQKNAEWIKRWTSTRVTVEGHADERGSAEYNLALGERRAASVRDYLVSLGIGTDRISIVTKGKESPFCTESNESCWQQNRRGHFIITAK